MELHLLTKNVEGLCWITTLGEDEDEGREVARVLVAVREVEGRGLDEPASIHTVTTRPRLALRPRRRSDGHLDGVTVSESRIGAVDAKLKLRNSKKLTLSQRPLTHLFYHISHHSISYFIYA